MGAQSTGDECLEPAEVLEAGAAGFTADQLEPHVDYVADIYLQNESKISGLIVAVSSTSLIIEDWDSMLHRTNGDLSTLAIKDVARISIP